MKVKQNKYKEFVQNKKQIHLDSFKFYLSQIQQNIS